MEAITAVMANCIQHHWNARLIGLLADSIMDLTGQIPVRELGFVPDKSVIDFILADE